MRVIAGTARGRKLKVPGVRGLRPTADRARETLFNVLANRIEGVRFLDVFAGSGAVGIEALSRGAAAATFVEHSRQAGMVIEGNLERCGFAQARVVIGDWRAALRRLGREGARFDLVFFDPPYAWGDPEIASDAAAPPRGRRRPWGRRDRYQDCLEATFTHGLLAAGGLAVLEHDSARSPGVSDGWRLERRLRVGDSAFSLYARSAEDE